MTERLKGSEAVDDSEDWYCLKCDHEMPIGAMVCEHWATPCPRSFGAMFGRRRCTDGRQGGGSYAKRSF